MRKFISAIIVSLFCWQAAQAGEPVEYGLFNHIGVGASIGTEGYGFDLAVPVTRWAAVRVGISKNPDIRYSKEIEVRVENKLTDDEIKVEAKLNDEINYKLLVDLYPFKNSSFHLTGGAYLGPKNIVSVYNAEPFLDEKDWGTTGVKIGDYNITSDENGNIRANLEGEKELKPYVGIGFGYAVPKRRLNVTFDMGAKFWGEPGIYMTTKDSFGDSHYEKLTKEGLKDLGEKDVDKAFDIMSKVIAYPVISIRLSGRIF